MLVLVYQPVRRARSSDILYHRERSLPVCGYQLTQRWETT